MDERKVLKKFIQNSSLHFKDFDEFKLEEMCQKLTAHDYAPSRVLCKSLEYSSGVWFVLNGTLNIFEFVAAKPVLVN